ncbi:MAG TPA: hypothetical protein VLH08_11325 [Acidobacteriota bacterium]|jgi:hypothetical protein|nr:hypothetical protein [Acidobacteriota bacterium]
MVPHLVNVNSRPKTITALSIFFTAGVAFSFISVLALLFPHSFLHSIWRLNPRALTAFQSIGIWAILLLTAVSLCCSFAAVGLWKGRIWGFRLAIALLVTNLIGDIYNFVSGVEPRAVVGIPIVFVILILVFRTRHFFTK